MIRETIFLIISAIICMCSVVIISLRFWNESMRSIRTATHITILLLTVCSLVYSVLQLTKDYDNKFVRTILPMTMNYFFFMAWLTTASHVYLQFRPWRRPKCLLALKTVLICVAILYILRGISHFENYSGYETLATKIFLYIGMAVNIFLIVIMIYVLMNTWQSTGLLPFPSSVNKIVSTRERRIIIAGSCYVLLVMVYCTFVFIYSTTSYFDSSEEDYTLLNIFVDVVYCIVMPLSSVLVLLYISRTGFESKPKIERRQQRVTVVGEAASLLDANKETLEIDVYNTPK
eukprot:TRINITY_DN17959_c0_g1_i1.p1 TRINITY_DN17959_c0_g1~~TRINITY_DN17959_c0_g1_i1.p1  ORF type:complete len:289 (-),score=10.99 TRINITY_DN17959_c0_g1_i1:159-1025(-)